MRHPSPPVLIHFMLAMPFYAPTGIIYRKRHILLTRIRAERGIKMELFFTNTSLLIKGSPREIKEYFEMAVRQYPTLDALLQANLN